MSEATATESTETDGDGDGDAGYSGVLGTYPYAFRHSESRLMCSYVVLGGLYTLLIAVLFTFAVVTTIGSTVGAGGGTFSFVRSFVLVVGVLVVVPLMAPVVFVARRHRREGSTRQYDRALAAYGYLLAVSVYMLLVVSAPPELREEPSGALAPLVSFLYDLPAIAGAVFPLAAILVGYLLHRRYQ